MTQSQGAPPEPRILSQGWFYHHQGREQGPMDLESLREALRLRPRSDVLIWHSSLPEWVEANDERIVDLLVAPARPVQPTGLLPLLFSFKGRVGRWRYLGGCCLLIAPAFALAHLAQALSKSGMGPDETEVVRFVLLLPVFWIGSALSAKRLHDLDLSAGHLAWLLPVTTAANLVPVEPARSIVTFGGAAAELWLLLKRGSRGENRYGPAPIGGTISATGSTATSAGWKVARPLVVLAALLVGASVLLVYSGRSLESLRSSPSLCSDPGVLATLRGLVGKDPSLIVVGAYYGSFSNIQISFRGVRTLDGDNPARGSTCAAMMHVSAIDRSKASIGDQDLSDVEYTVQYVDGSNTEYVVNLAH